MFLNFVDQIANDLYEARLRGPGAEEQAAAEAASPEEDDIYDE